VYVGDSRARVRKIDAVTGIITTVAGNGTPGFSGDDGPATQALLTQPTHLTAGPDGSIYFLDNNVRVRRIAPDGIITTVAGNGTVGETGDGGPAVEARLNTPIDDNGDVAVDPSGNVFILETEGQRVRKVHAKTGIITTFASRDALGQAYRKARGLATDASGNVYVATQNNINKYDPAGRLIDSWFIGHGFSEDGAIAKQALIGGPLGMAIAPNGDIIYSDEGPPRLRKINLATGRIETLAGMAPEVIGVPGPAVGAVFTSPWGDLAFLPTGDLLHGDGASNFIYRIDLRSGMLTKFAGTGGIAGGYDQIPALQTDLISGLVGMETDSRGQVYFADKVSIRSIDPQGITHRIAGGLANAPCTLAGDEGPAPNALLCQPQDVALDRDGNLYIADTNNNRIRRVDAQSGVITTVVGSGPVNGFEGYGRGSFCGDGGPALQACLNTPIAVVVRDDGTMYVVDYYNKPFIRKITPEGTISSVANWPRRPTKLAVGPGQSILATGGTQMYRVDNDRVRIIAGNGILGFGGDGGPARSAMLASGESDPAWGGIAVDAEGNLFFHDAGNRRVRVVRYGAVLAPVNATIQATASGSLIRATVFDADGGPAAGVRVDFTAPSSGASCALSNAFGITDVNGVAAVTCTSNCIAGTYSVNAQPLTASSQASVLRTNPSAPCRRRAVRR
jgi:sugar lactone lactonase YvrE